jgi:hypothetical protein
MCISAISNYLSFCTLFHLTEFWPVRTLAGSYHLQSFLPIELALSVNPSLQFGSVLRQIVGQINLKTGNLLHSCLNHLLFLHGFWNIPRRGSLARIQSPVVFVILEVGRLNSIFPKIQTKSYQFRVESESPEILKFSWFKFNDTICMAGSCTSE